MTVGATIGSVPAIGARQVVENARRCQQLGFRSCWLIESTGFDAFALLAACGEAAPVLDLGTGVIPFQTRSPLLAAMGAASLQSLRPERRVLLGVGVSSAAVAERWHGMRYGEAPVAQMREYLGLLRRLLAGERVTHEGRFYRVAGAHLDVPLADRRPVLVLAAMNPRMMRLAGALADGVLMNYLPPELVPDSIARVREGEAEAGRYAGSCRTYGYVHCAVAPRTSEILDDTRREVVSYAMADSYARALERAGFGDELVAMREAFARRDRAGAVAAISDRLIDAVELVGEPADVRAYVASYLAAGVDEVIVDPLGRGEDVRTVITDTIEAVAGLEAPVS